MKRAFWLRMQALDRRWIFVVLLLVTVYPLLWPVGLPLDVSPPTRAAYDRIEAVPSGATVLLSWDFDPGSQAELLPAAEAILHHLFRKDVKVVVMTLWPAAPTLATTALKKISARYGKVEGVDWVNLGYKPGLDVVVKAMGDDIHDIFPANQRGDPVADIPVMAGIRTYADVDLIIDLAAGNSVEVYVQQAVERNGAELVVAVTGVMIADFYPYLEARQLKGMVGALKGAAEYEILVGTREIIGRAGDATMAMDSQSFAHLAILAFILLGNLGYFLGGRPGGVSRLKSLRGDKEGEA
ncbi:hypothetical protein IIA16_06575 [bacterium]|nr:hypothetical protein [bacterium]